MKRIRHKRWFWDAYAAVYDALPRYFKPYGIQLERVMQLVGARHEAGGTWVLDAGCGTGSYVAHLHARGYRVLGLDNSASMLSRARRKVPLAVQVGRQRIVFCKASLIPPLRFPNGTFACVISINALYMLEHPKRVLAEFARVLRPRGTLILSHPCRIPGLWEIVADHARRFGLLSILRPFFPLAVLGFFNWIIARKFKQRGYICWSWWELQEALITSGFRIKTTEDAYACDSNLLVSAVKERMP